MAQITKKQSAARAKVDRSQNYPLKDAIELVKGSAYCKFDETVDLAVRLGVDPRHADQMVRGAVVLPNGLGKEVRVLVGDYGEALLKTGATLEVSRRRLKDLLARFQS